MGRALGCFFWTISCSGIVFIFVVVAVYLQYAEVHICSPTSPNKTNDFSENNQAYTSLVRQQSVWEVSIFCISEYMDLHIYIFRKVPLKHSKTHDGRITKLNFLSFHQR